MSYTENGGELNKRSIFGDLNQTILMGRLTRDVECRWTAGDKPMAISRYTLAVNRDARKGAEKETDFINCIAFGGTAEFADRNFRKGTKVYVVGRIQTGSYQNKDGVRIPTFEILVREQGFAESKKAGNSEGSVNETVSASDVAAEGFMDIPEGLEEQMSWN